MNRNWRVLEDFTRFCQDHPELRFWQALMAWSGYQAYLLPHTTGRGPGMLKTLAKLGLKDPFHWEGKSPESGNKERCDG